jgi:branched-chain amino acid transport system substrate-binding protein
MKFNKFLLAGITPILLASTMMAHADEVKIGVVTFLSGAAASPFGVPARNAAELFIEQVNKGAAPAPYNTKGFGGSNVKMVLIDESGSSTSVVTEYRTLFNVKKSIWLLATYLVEIA